jgi:hypothetical protein
MSGQQARFEEPCGDKATNPNEKHCLRDPINIDHSGQNYNTPDGEELIGGLVEEIVNR